MRSDREEALEAEIARLDGLGLKSCAAVAPAPRTAATHISTDLTRRWLAYELQVKRLRRPRSGNPASPEAALARPSRPILTIRHRPTSVSSPALVLTREWNGIDTPCHGPGGGLRVPRRALRIAVASGAPNHRHPLVGAARSLASSAEGRRRHDGADPPLRRLHPQVLGGGARTGLQLPPCPDGRPARPT